MDHPGETAVLSAPSDEELVLAVGAGNVEALGLLATRWEQPLFRFVFKLLGRTEDARDVCQETFVRVLDKASHFRRGARFSTWMYQIALNICRDRARRRRRWSARIVGPLPDQDAFRFEPRADGEAPDETAARDEMKRAVRRALMRLPGEQREVIVLKEYENMKFREIADVLGVPESTVKSRMYVALDAMRESLAREGVSG